MSFRSGKCALVVGLLVPFATAATTGSAAAAQSVALTGHVYDARVLDTPAGSSVVVPSGLKTVANAHVSVDGTTATAVTDSAGAFSITGLVAGDTYDLTIVAAGLGTVRDHGVKLEGASNDVFVGMHQAPTDVSAAAPAVPAASPASAQAVTPFSYVRCGHNSSGWTSQTTQPSTIRVYIGGKVTSYDFTFYLEHVLPGEWGGSEPIESLKAGAVAIRDYAWYYVLNGSKGTSGSVDPCSFDVDATTAYQYFDPSEATTTNTNSAVTITSGWLLNKNGSIPETSFCRTIVNCGPTTPPETCGQNANGSTMSQTGSWDCASKGDGFAQILSIYYPSYTLTQIGSAASGLQVVLSAAGGVSAKTSSASGWTSEVGSMKAIAASGSTQMLLRGDNTVWARASGLGSSGWTDETSGITAIAVGPTGVQLVLDGAGKVWAKSSGVGIGGFISESPNGEKAIAVGGGGVQMILDGAGHVWAKSGVANGGWVQESTTSSTAIAVDGSGDQIRLDANGDVWAKTASSGFNTSGWTREVVSTAIAIAAGAGGLQMYLDSTDAVHAHTTISNVWTWETANIFGIAAGASGLQMVRDSSGGVWAKNGVGGGGFVPDSGTYQAIAAG